MSVNHESFLLDAVVEVDAISQALADRFPVRLEPSRRFDRTFFDTFDWRLFRAGIRLRQDKDGRRNVCWCEFSADSTLEPVSFRGSVPRLGVKFPDDDRWSPVRKAIGPRILLPLVRETGRSTVLSMLNRRGVAVLRLQVDDQVSCLPPGSRTGIPRNTRLHLALLGPLRPIRRDLVAVVRDHFGITPIVAGAAFVDSLAAIGRSPGDYSSKFHVNLDPAMTAIDAIRLIYRHLLATVRANYRGTIDALDSEFLHDFRVAIRRTRSGLSQMSEILPGGITTKFRQEFGWLGRQSGLTRDLDVFAEAMAAEFGEIRPEHRATLKPFLDFLTRERIQEHANLARELRSEPCRRLIEQWESFLESPLPPTELPPSAFEPIAGHAARWIALACRRVLDRGERLKSSSSRVKFHKLRIECKKLRYLLEFFQSLYPPEQINPLIDDLKLLQDNLGEFNDLAVQQESIDTHADRLEQGGLGNRGLFLAMGQLQGLLAGRQDKARKAFKKHWRQFSRPENLERLATLFGL